jgi:MFS family permease
VRTTGRRRRIWVQRPPTWFVRLLVVVLLVHISVNLIRPMVSYRVLELGVPARYLGLISASFALVPLAVGIAVGRRVDRFGPRRFQIAGAVLLAVSGLGIGLFGDLSGLVAMFVIFGLGHLLVMVAAQTTVANESSEDLLDRRFGQFAFFAAIGQLVGPMIGGLVATHAGANGTRWALLVGGVVAVLSVPPAIAAPVHAGRVRRTTGDPDDEPPPTTSLRSVLATPGLTGSLIVSLVVIAAVDILVVYLPALGEERGLTIAAVSALLTARAAASMVSRIGLGWMVDRLGRIRLLFIAVVISGLAVAALPFTTSLATAMVAMAIAGFALGICQPLTMAWVATETSAETRGTAMSIRLSANRLGQVALPAAAGLMAGFAGTAGVLWVVGGAVVATGAAVRQGRRRA